MIGLRFLKKTYPNPEFGFALLMKLTSLSKKKNAFLYFLGKADGALSKCLPNIFILLAPPLITHIEF